LADPSPFPNRRSSDLGGASMPEVPQWARVRGDMNCHVRRGACYGVLHLTPDEAILDVVRRPFSVPRSSLQIVPLPPQRWSVVAQIGRAHVCTPVTVAS